MQISDSVSRNCFSFLSSCFLFFPRGATKVMPSSDRPGDSSDPVNNKEEDPNFIGP